MSRVRIDIGSLQMNNGVADSDGVRWWVGRGIEGWDSAEVQQSVDGVTGHHGGSLAASQYWVRRITIPGRADCPSEEATWAAHARIVSLVGLSSPSAMTVYETAPKSVDVILGGTPRAEARPSLGRVEWSLSLLALSPFKRGASHTVSIAAGDSATVTYAGSWPGAPTITTTAPGALDVTNATTATRVATAAVPSGTVAVCAEPGHTVYSGSTNLYGLLVQPVAWLRLAVGANTIMNGGTAPITLTYSDLYL